MTEFSYTRVVPKAGTYKRQAEEMISLLGEFWEVNSENDEANHPLYPISMSLDKTRGNHLFKIVKPGV